ncbi:MAG: helix-turn-helix domain-containing protein [Coriobacteriia bacterium]
MRPVSAASDPDLVQEIRQKQTILTDEQIQEMVVDYRAGRTVYELADKFECARETVSLHLRAKGVRMRMQPLSEQLVDEIVRLYESGLSCAKVAKAVGVDEKTVWNRLKERGVAMRGAHERRGPRRPNLESEAKTN